MSKNFPKKKRKQNDARTELTYIVMMDGDKKRTEERFIGKGETTVM